MGQLLSEPPVAKWHVSGWSFPASVQAPLLLNRKVRLVDIKFGSWLAVDSKRDEHTGLSNVIPFGGALSSAAFEYSGELIIDAAASLASRPLGLEKLSSSHAVIFFAPYNESVGRSRGWVCHLWLSGTCGSG